MSVASVQPSNPAPHSPVPVRTSSGRWIINSWLDFVLFVWTPLFIIPVILFLHSSYVGIEVETIALIVVAFGALGHHLPGMIRAYCDRDLFERFQLRFVLAPIILFVVFFPLYLHHFSAMKLILTVWACWHGFMQIYGFVRIYDAKVGCVAPVTAYWDWLMCLSWCSTAQIMSHEKMSGVLEHWYKFGGPLIPPAYVYLFRWTCLAISIAVLIGFLINHVAQTYQGPAPNSAKLMMLASGIGFWWFCMVGIGNIILGAALFEIFHDIQYLAIVWLYNCRRVTSNPDNGAFMKFVFRRGMLLLYVGLVFAYGVIGLVPHFAKDESIKTTFMGILWTSTILHYYYDGFIWKVREKTTQASLGLSAGAATTRPPRAVQNELIHLLKWSPLIALLSWLFVTDFMGSAKVPQSRLDELTQRYTQTLSGSSVLPEGIDERAWLYSQFEQLQNIAAADPEDASSQVRAAIMLANFGRNDEAVQLLEKLLKHQRSVASAHQALGEIQRYRGRLDDAAKSFQSAVSSARTSGDRSKANLKLGEVYLQQNQPDLAKSKFREALRDNPQLEAAVNALRKN